MGSPAADRAVSVVVPTVGRLSLRRLLDSLDRCGGEYLREVILVDDRRPGAGPLAAPAAIGGAPVRVLRTAGGKGPATARNLGWRAAGAPWVAFLDDDVVVEEGWGHALAADLRSMPPLGAASQGRIRVPRPTDRRPTDWERNVAGLESATWATADMAYRRDVLEEVGGFDERFPRAYREDADLGLRVSRAGWLLLRGRRTVTHPVGPAGRWVSIGLQVGNRDDALMRALHGSDWRRLAHAGPGRTPLHVATTAALAAALAGVLAGRRRSAAVGATAWLAATAPFAVTRILPGPRTRAETAAMIVSSAAIPPVAVYHYAAGWLGSHRRPGRHRPWGLPAGAGPAVGCPTVRRRLRFGPLPRPLAADPRWSPKAVLFDRDGTLILDRHYPRDPAAVRSLPGARVALDRVRQAGLLTGVITNQSGIGRGFLSDEEVDAVNSRVEEVLGPFDCWSVCRHAPEDACRCRKPRPGLVTDAALALGVPPSDCVVIGDIGADVSAAHAAGARAVLVPTRRTRPREIRAARQVAPDLLAAVDLAMAGRC